MTLGGGTLLSTGTVTTARSLNLSALTGGLDATGGNTLTLTGPIAGSGAPRRAAAAGTVVLAQSGGLSLGGDVNVTGGTLAVGNPTATPALNVPGAMTVGTVARPS